MKEFVYKLKSEIDLNGELVSNPLKGKVKLKVLPFLERTKIIEDLSFKSNGEDVVNPGNMEVIKKMAKYVRESLVEMDVSKGKKKFSSLDEIDYDNTALNFYSEIGGVICNGVDLGNA